MWFNISSTDPGHKYDMNKQTRLYKNNHLLVKRNDNTINLSMKSVMLPTSPGPSRSGEGADEQR